MGDWIKRALLLVLVAGGGWKGYQYWRRGHTTHQLVFRAEGPSFCMVSVRYATDTASPQQQVGLPWQSEAVSAAGNADVTFTVEVPRSCNWQPDQLHCIVERDGLPWKDVAAWRVTDTRDGSALGLQCDVRARGWE